MLKTTWKRKIEKRLKPQFAMQHASFTEDISASTILRNEPPEFLETLNQWISFKSGTLKRCYRASEDGWHSHIFHLQCGQVGETVTLIKVGRYIFGGFSDKEWGRGKRAITMYFLFESNILHTPKVISLFQRYFQDWMNIAYFCCFFERVVSLTKFEYFKLALVYICVKAVFGIQGFIVCNMPMLFDICDLKSHLFWLGINPIP
jgi:hypothetical protein